MKATFECSRPLVSSKGELRWTAVSDSPVDSFAGYSHTPDSVFSVHLSIALCFYSNLSHVWAHSSTFTEIKVGIAVIDVAFSVAIF